MSSVDVAITSYQYGRFLRQSAISVLTQAVPNLRLLIIDNASTDGSQEIAKRIADGDRRVTLMLNERNRGYIDSFNRAVEWASADYFVLLDADDLLAAGSLERGTAILDAHPEVGLLYGVEGRLLDGLLDPSRADATTTRVKVTKGADFIRRTCSDSFCDIGAPAVLRRTSVQKKAGYFRESLIPTADFEMYLRMALLGDVASTNRMLGIRRQHRCQMSVPVNDNPVRDFMVHEKAFVAFFAAEGAAMPDAKELERTMHRSMGQYAYWYGLWQLLHGRPNAQEAFAFAAERRPGSGMIPPVSFLWKRRWLRSVYRSARRITRKPVPLNTTNYGVSPDSLAMSQSQ